MKIARLAIDRPVTALMFYVAIRFLPRFFLSFRAVRRGIRGSVRTNYGCFRPRPS